jgi:hypothetical protein
MQSLRLGQVYPAREDIEEGQRGAKNERKPIKDMRLAIKERVNWHHGNLPSKI